MPAAKTPAAKRATIAKVRAASAVPTEDINIPEFGGLVTVSGLTAKTQLEVAEAEGDFQANLLVACVVAPALSYEDALAIYQGPVGPFNQIALAISRCNGEGGSEESTRRFPEGASE